MDAEPLTPFQTQVYEIYSAYGLYFFVFILLIGAWEVASRIHRRKLNWHYVLDSISSIATLPLIGVMAYLATLIGIGSIYSVGYVIYEQYAIHQVGWSIGSVLLVLLATDFWYYWEHRAFHRINVMWATHTVHHSSDYINIPMAYRFGPLDSFFTGLFHLPLAFFFDPALVLIGIVANPDLPGMDTYRRDQKNAGLVRIPVQHAIPPPGASRPQRAIHRQELWRLPDHLGPNLRNLRTRGQTSRVWNHQAAENPRPRHRAVPRLLAPGRQIDYGPVRQRASVLPHHAARLANQPGARAPRGTRRLALPGQNTLTSSRLIQHIMACVVPKYPCGLRCASGIWGAEFDSVRITLGVGKPIGRLCDDA